METNYPDDEVFVRITAAAVVMDFSLMRSYISPNKPASMISKAIEDEDIVIDNVDIDIPLNEFKDDRVILIKDPKTMT